MKTLRLALFGAVPALAHHLLSRLSDFGVQCQSPSLLPDLIGRPTCSSDSTTLMTRHGEIQNTSIHSKWHISTPCAQNGSEVYCAYSYPSFARGRGITVLTTPERAEQLAQSTVFLNETLLNDISNLNAIDNPKWALQSISGKDIGVVATQRFEVGDHIMSATPSIMVDYGIFDALEAQYISRLQAAGIDLLPPSHRADFLNLSTHDPVETHEDRIGKVLLTNAFDLASAGDIQESDDANSWYTVFPHVSRFNHDCRPNADYYFDPVTFTQRVHAVRPILPGEEITISYMDLIQTREERRQRIQNTWHFDCSCSLCTQDAEQIAASDARIRQVIEIREQLRDYSSASQATAQMAELMVSLYEQERMWAMLYEAYTYAAIEWNGVGEPWLATKYARLAIQYGLACGGPKDSDVIHMKELAKDPWSHWSWMLRTKKRMNWGSKVSA
ncbi:hypothetical protein F5Y19DRAFT_477549 [Xylariaceae sp. FL1651]|nr:hypothetical protein F5Y19DRAFT_477549 [Xylariaceae sp. FL1651]